MLVLAGLVAMANIGSAGDAAAQRGRTVRGQGAQRLAFVLLRPRLGTQPIADIALINADGSGRKIVTRIHETSRPAWSADGRRIAFLYHHRNETGDHYEVGVVSASGGGERILTDGEYVFSGPAWTPNQFIAVATTQDQSRQPDVWSVDPNRPTHRVQLTTALGLDTDPVWSPNGKVLAYVGSGNETVSNNPFQVYTVTANGANRRQLTRGSNNVGPPSWSPDGRRVAFSSFRDGNFEIYVADVNGGSQRRITRSPLSDLAPVWSPDGKAILFSRDMDGDYQTSDADIWLVRPDGSNAINLTHNPAADQQASWSPDSGAIAFVSNRNNGSDIYLMDVRGNRVRNLTKSPKVGESQPTWAPR